MVDNLAEKVDKCPLNRGRLHTIGTPKAAIIRSREVAAKQGFLKYYSEWRCRLVSAIDRVGRSSGVAVKRGSTVFCGVNYMFIISWHDNNTQLH